MECIPHQAINSGKRMKQRDTMVIEMESVITSKSDIIEDMISRFPHLAEYIFKQLDTKNLKSCLNVSKQWCNFIQNERFPWKRMIQTVYNELTDENNSSLGQE